MTSSIYRRALGDDFDRMHPQLQRFFGRPAVSADGVFDEVGSRHRWLAPVWRLLSRFGLLVPDYGTDVPFTVHIDPLSENRLATTRRIRFRGGVRVMSDETHLVAGRLIDVFARGRLLLHTVPRVEEDGSLTMTVDATRLRIAGILLWMPPVSGTLSQRWDESQQAHRIDVSVRLPLLGEVFGYRGSFRLT